MKKSRNCPARRLDLTYPVFQQSIIAAATVSLVCHLGAMGVVLYAVTKELLK